MQVAEPLNLKHSQELFQFFWSLNTRTQRSLGGTRDASFTLQLLLFLGHYFEVHKCSTYHLYHLKALIAVNIEKFLVLNDNEQ
eukprot:g71665.t1